MKIVLIGAGNVATSLAKALARQGRTPEQIWSRTPASAKALADVVGSRAVSDWAEVERDADLYIVAVKDDAMATVVDGLCAHCRKGIFVHTAGTVSMELFRGNAEHYGVFYPMQTFSKWKEVDFKDIPCFVEASDEATLNVVMDFARSLSDNVRFLKEADRKWLHVAAVFACNFANACNAMAADVLESHGLDFGVMLPLIDEMTAKLHHMHPHDAQTGPASRGDKAVVGQHLGMLAGNEPLLGVYRAVSEYINPQLNLMTKKK